ncbi:regulator of G protein signaling domain protein [Opisthorchis viverrini]|uniref:Regulator of G protein signaling domain protein n=2 Tax=Opisthorchis viverrini TaxID=6198 RepID=A0A1S8X3P9_OPIVI|nr:regulator of G protein signaling domain protein [Opisthorchis viverrini]
MALQALADPRHFYGIPEQETKFFCNNGIIDSGFPRSSRRVPEAMEALLCDSDGVERFNQFLRSNYSSGHLLDFWFACKGFRSNVDPNDSDKLFQVAKVIYRTYIKSGATCAVPLPSPLKHDIIGRMSSYHRGYKSSKGPIPASTAIDRSLFDLAQKSVMSLLEQTYYPKFVEFVNGPPSPSRPCNDAVPNSISGSMLLSSTHPPLDCQTLSHSFTEKTPRSKMRWKRKGHKLVPEQLVGK